MLHMIALRRWGGGALCLATMCSTDITLAFLLSLRQYAGSVRGLNQESKPNTAKIRGFLDYQNGSFVVGKTSLNKVGIKSDRSVIVF